jgi:hypothetical protein
MSTNTEARDLALDELLDAATKVDECVLAIREKPAEDQLALLVQRYDDLVSQVRRLAYRFVRFDTAATLAKFARPSVRSALIGAAITVATALGECMALAEAKLTAGQDAEKIIDGIVKLEHDLCNQASDLSAMEAALTKSEANSATPRDPAVEGVRSALVKLQEIKGKKKAQAALKRYAPTGRLGSLKHKDHSKLLADVRRILTLHSVK